MARRLRYQAAASLDGFIADVNGGYDWIVHDPAIDFSALFGQFDTVVMGRKTFDVTSAQDGGGSMPGMQVFVFSRTLPAAARDGVTITGDDPAQVVAALKNQPGRDIWLYGGGILFRSLLDAGLVDTVEVAVMPVMLGSGIPLVTPGPLATLTLADRKVLPASGIIVLAYQVSGCTALPPRIEYVKTSPDTSG